MSQYKTSPPVGYYFKDLGEEHLPQLLEIVNYMILNTLSIWRTTPDTLEGRKAWLATTKAAGYPAIGLFTIINDGLVGFVSSGSFNYGDGFQKTTECAIALRPQETGKGLGTFLLQCLIERLCDLKFNVIVAGISGTNQGSARFFSRAGFLKTAHMPAVGEKNGQVLDLELWQLDLREKQSPS